MKLNYFFVILLTTACTIETVNLNVLEGIPIFLHELVSQNNIDEVEKIFQAVTGIENWYSNHRDNEGRTPLHIAVLHNHNEMVDLLLNYGANPIIEDREQKTVFDYALHGEDTLGMWEKLSTGVERYKSLHTTDKVYQQDTPACDAEKQKFFIDGIEIVAISASNSDDGESYTATLDNRDTINATRSATGHISCYFNQTAWWEAPEQILPTDYFDQLKNLAPYFCEQSQPSSTLILVAGTLLITGACKN